MGCAEELTRLTTGRRRGNRQDLVGALQARAALYRSLVAGRRILIVLDNADQVTLDDDDHAASLPAVLSWSFDALAEEQRDSTATDAE